MAQAKMPLQAQTMMPTDSNHARNDPRYPGNRPHGLYNELKERISDASEGRPSQFTAACHAQNYGRQSVHNPSGRGDMTIGAHGKSLLSTPAPLDLNVPPPPPQPSIRQIQQHDLSQTQIKTQIQAHNSARAQQRPAGVR